MDRIEDYEKYRELVKRNIEYEGLILHEEKEVIDNIVDIMADVLTFRLKAIILTMYSIRLLW